MSKRGRKKGRDISGIVLLDKPSGVTSNAALQRVKKIYFAAKAGHTGTLHPLASGMLPICFGGATRLSQYMIDSDKVYRVQAALGVRTDTLDADGDEIETADAHHVDETLITQTIQQFIGTQNQMPPMYSALKHEGKRLYELARAGIEVVRKSREITIFNIDVLSVEAGQSFELEVHCSKGTYIRSLIDDVARAMNTCAMVSGLRRCWVNPFQEQTMHTLDALEEMNNDARACAILPPDVGLEFMSRVEVSAAQAQQLSFGQPIEVAIEGSEQYRIYRDDGLFLGVGDGHHTGQLAPKRLMFNQETLNQYPQVE